MTTLLPTPSPISRTLATPLIRSVAAVVFAVATIKQRLASFRTANPNSIQP